MAHIIGIRREDLSKKGEKRVALVPQLVQQLVAQGFKVQFQTRHHPETGESKRAFSDTQYEQAGADIQEDLSQAQPIFGLKEIELDHILPEKAYYFFSHTHKGQVKNRKMLRKLIAGKNSLIDYELICNEQGQRLITAFTYFAGYAGMIDSMWTLGKRLATQGINHPFSRIPQSIEKEDLSLIKQLIKAVGASISQHGTPEHLPPLITAFLGNGKTSFGAQQIYDGLPVEEISLDRLAYVFEYGSRNKVYKLVLDIPQLYRIKADSPLYGQVISDEDFFQRYLKEPHHFETNLDQIFPYCSIWMNCILWGPDYPRLISRDQTQAWYQDHQTLRVIGDITCDPEGAIHFSKETWIDDPVFIYHPDRQSQTAGFEGEGIAVMAVTNLPCEFPADASEEFSQNLSPMMADISNADYHAENPSAAGLPAAIQRAVILWKGEFMPAYNYMQAYVSEG